MLLVTIKNENKATQETHKNMEQQSLYVLVAREEVKSKTTNKK